VYEKAVARLDRCYELDAHHAALPLRILAKGVGLARLDDGNRDRHIPTDETSVDE